MVLNEVTPPAQLNIYKQENLTNKIRKLLHSSSKFQTNLALSVLHDWSWTRPRKALIASWTDQYKSPLPPSKSLSLLQYNIQHLYANQCDLVDMIEQHAPSIISLNELGTKIPPKTIQRLLFAYSVYQQSGINPHGGSGPGDRQVFESRTNNHRRSEHSGSPGSSKWKNVRHRLYLFATHRTTPATHHVVTPEGLEKHYHSR